MEKQKHLSKFERVENPPNIFLQQRDIDLFESLAKYRYLTTTQLHNIIFTGLSPTSIRRRLFKLYHNAYIDRLFTDNPQSTKPVGEACYFLDKDGYNVLVSERDYDGAFQAKNKRVKAVFLNHTIAIIDFRLSIEKGLKNNKLAYLPENAWFSEYDMQDPMATKKRDKYIIYDEVYDSEINRRVSLYPDSLFVLNGLGKYADYQALYFVEIDRGTESSKKILKKLRAYDLYLKNKGFKKYADVNFFKVLFVTTSQKRIDALLENLQDNSGLDLFLFSHFEETKNNNVITDSIWLKPDGEVVSIIK